MVRGNNSRTEGNNPREDDEPANPGMRDMLRVLADMTAAMQRGAAQPELTPEERQSRAFKMFMDQHPPKFSGGPNPEEAESWLTQIQNMLEVTATPPVYHVLFGANLLISEASRWWSSVKARQAVDQLTWDQFVALFNKHYIRGAYRISKMHEFMELVQGETSVSDYAFQFTSLSRYCPQLVADEPTRAFKFQQGLKSGIRSRLVAFQYGTFDEVVEAALLLEQEFERFQRQRTAEKGSKSKGKSVQGGKRNQFNAGGSGGKSSKGRNQSGSSSGSSGRSSPYGDKGSKSRGSVSGPVRCFFCNQEGHIQKNCWLLNQGQQEVQPYQSQYQPFPQQGYPNPQPLRTVDHPRPQIQYPQQGFQNPGQQQIQQRPRGQQQNPRRGGGGNNRNNQARAYAMVQPNEGAPNAVLEGNFLVYNSWARVLFDSGANHSFIAYSFARSLGLLTPDINVCSHIVRITTKSSNLHSSSSSSSSDFVANADSQTLKMSGMMFLN